MPTYIYESPDNGATLYRRRAGETKKELIRVHPLGDQLLRSQHWREIFLAAETDPVLKELIERVEIYHSLKNSPQNR